MSYFQALRSVLTSPSIIQKKEHLILLSHMRANTSLVGHVLGSHPQINGYYEMHIGYYSTKSFLRQKVLYAEQHQIKKSSKYMFDKVLHNEHHVCDSIIEHANSHFMLSTRAPDYTVPSIVSLYKKSDPTHEFTQPEYAAKYYCERLNYLENIVKRNDFNYLYFDADAIKVTPTSALRTFSSFLGLETPLSSKYKKMHNTGRTKAGDSSSSLMKGEIIRSELKPTSVSYETAPFFNECKQTYERVRASLLNNAKESIIL